MRLTRGRIRGDALPQLDLACAMSRGDDGTRLALQDQAHISQSSQMVEGQETRLGKGDGGDGIHKLVRGDRREEDAVDGPEAQNRARARRNLTSRVALSVPWRQRYRARREGTGTHDGDEVDSRLMSFESMHKAVSVQVPDDGRLVLQESGPVSEVSWVCRGKKTHIGSRNDNGEHLGGSDTRDLVRVSSESCNRVELGWTAVSLADKLPQRHIRTGIGD